MRVLLRLTRVELLLFLREPMTAVFTLLLPLVLLLVLGGVFGNTPDPTGAVYRGVGPMDFYTPAYLGLVVASMGLIGLPVHLAAYRERGVLRRFRASTLRPAVLLGSQALVTVGLSAVAGIALTVMAFMVYDVQRPRALLGSLACFLLVALCFAALGVLLGAVSPTARGAQGVGIMLWFVMMLLGGSGPPPEVLPRAMRVLGDLTPLKHGTILLQDQWLGWGWNLKELLVVLGFLVAAALLSLRFFRWE